MQAVRDWTLEPPTETDPRCRVDEACVLGGAHAGPCVGATQVEAAARRIPEAVRITRRSLWEALLETLPDGACDTDVHALGAAVELAERARAVRDA